jgi:DNA repair protein SbcD/Mre11
MIRFIHTADLHFGVENYGKIDQKTGMHSRLLDFDHAFNLCIDYAIKEKVDLFLFSGDAYKTALPSPTQQRLLLRAFLRLYEARIPVAIIVGNHDHPLSFGKAHALDIFSALPMNGFYVFNKPKVLTIKTTNGPIQILGIPWPNRSSLMLNAGTTTNSSAVTQTISKEVGKLISSLAKDLDPQLPSILGAHLTMSSGIFSGSEKRAIYGTDPIFLPSQLAIKPFDYVALGHLHRYQVVHKEHPQIIYSGSIERIDFGERKEEKGFCDVTIHDKETTTHTFIKIPTRPFIQVEAYLNETENQTEQILRAIKTHSIKNSIVKIVYHVPAKKDDHVDLKTVQRACISAQYLVGIFPVKKIVTRERRTQVKLDMKIENLLEEYFKQKPELKERTPKLLKKIKNIMQEMEQE